MSRLPLPIDWRAVAKLYEVGWTQRRLAEHYRVHWITVQRHLSALGAKKPARQKRPPPDRRLRFAWVNMRRRCEDPKHHSYHRYGARGAKVAAAWAEFEPFRAWALEAGYEPGQSLHRRDERRAFSPRNCYWGVRRRDTAAPKYKAFGESKTVEEWARDKRCVVSADALSRRLRYGVEPEAAISQPARPGYATGPKVRPRRRARKIDWARILDLRQRGMTAAEIARKLEVPYATVQVGLRKSMGQRD